MAGGPRLPWSGTSGIEQSGGRLLHLHLNTEITTMNEEGVRQYRQRGGRDNYLGSHPPTSKTSSWQENSEIVLLANDLLSLDVFDPFRRAFLQGSKAKLNEIMDEKEKKDNTTRQHPTGKIRAQTSPSTSPRRTSTTTLRRPGGNPCTSAGRRGIMARRTV